MTLQDAIEVELQTITIAQHALARQKTFLTEAQTQLRMGASQSVVEAQLKNLGIVLAVMA